MSDEYRPHPPTDTHLERVRKEGSIPWSAEFTQGVSLLVCASLLMFGGGTVAQRLKYIFIQAFQPELLARSTPETAAAITRAAASELFAISSAMGVLVFIAVGIASVAQTKPILSFGLISPKMSRLNPFLRFKKTFVTARFLRNGCFLLSRGILLAISFYWIIREPVRDLLQPRSLTVSEVVVAGAYLSFQLLLAAGACAFVFGTLDLHLQRRDYRMDHMMKEAEVRQEFRDDEVSPIIRQKRDELRQLLQSAGHDGGIDHVHKATVVLINPTHFTVALEYNIETDEPLGRAPRVIAKGCDAYASEILSRAQRHHIPIRKNVPLCRSLYRVRLGNEIPPELYVAVDCILAELWSDASQASIRQVLPGSANGTTAV